MSAHPILQMLSCSYHFYLHLMKTTVRHASVRASGARHRLSSHMLVAGVAVGILQLISLRFPMDPCPSMGPTRSTGFPRRHSPLWMPLHQPHLSSTNRAALLKASSSINQLLCQEGSSLRVLGSSNPSSSSRVLGMADGRARARELQGHQGLGVRVHPVYLAACLVTEGRCYCVSACLCRTLSSSHMCHIHRPTIIIVLVVVARLLLTESGLLVIS